MAPAIMAFLLCMSLLWGLARSGRGKRSDKSFSFPNLLVIAFLSSAALGTVLSVLRRPWDSPTEQETYEFSVAMEDGTPTSEIRAMLDEHPSLATNPLSDCELPIVRAASLKQSELVALLLDRGADPDARGGLGWPLLVAAFRNDVETGRILLEHGADPEQSGLLGMTAWDACQDETRREFRALLENHGKDHSKP
jgi:hypothetical protein